MKFIRKEPPEPVFKEPMYQMERTVILMENKPWPNSPDDYLNMAKLAVWGMKFDVPPDGINRLLMIQINPDHDPVMIEAFRTKGDNKIHMQGVAGKQLSPVTNWFECSMPPEYTKIWNENEGIRVYGDPIQDLYKKHADDSGYDLRAVSDGKIWPGETVNLSTGVAITFPKGNEMQIRGRSGLGDKYKVTVYQIGTVDWGYVGISTMPLINFGDRPFEYKRGDRLAQAVIAPVVTDLPVTFCQGDPPATKRGSSGHGHSGVR